MSKTTPEQMAEDYVDGVWDYVHDALLRGDISKAFLAGYHSRDEEVAHLDMVIESAKKLLFAKVGNKL